MRRKSVPGWLGNDVPEHYISTSHNNDEMPCHKTVDYSREDWELQVAPGKPTATTGTATACAGHAIYLANVLKLPRDRAVRRMQANHGTVFSTPIEFIAHHRSLGIVSGDFTKEAQAHADRQAPRHQRKKSKQPRAKKELRRKKSG